MRRVSIALVALALVAAACSAGNSDPAAESSPTLMTTAVSTTLTAPTTTSPIAPATTTTPPVNPSTTTRDTPSFRSAEWTRHETGDDCQCADGTGYSYWTRTASLTKVVLFFQGGGACFTASTCSFTDGTFSVHADDRDDPARFGGIFQLGNSRNPLSDWSFIFMPYCTGDVHIGNSVHEYAPGLIVRHNGFRNAEHGLNYLIDNFPDAREIFVAGSSAGGIAAPLFSGLVSDAFADAKISVLSDGSGSYPDIPDTNAALNDLWGSMSVVPDWEVNDAMTSAEWSIPGLFVQAGLHDPRIRMARFDRARDATQASFTKAAGIGSNERLARLDQNERNIEATGVNLHTFVAPGNAHTILLRRDLYALEVEGVQLIDWITAFIPGADVPDVHCQDCGP